MILFRLVFCRRISKPQTQESQIGKRTLIILAISDEIEDGHMHASDRAIW